MKHLGTSWLGNMSAIDCLSFLLFTVLVAAASRFITATKDHRILRALTRSIAAIVLLGGAAACPAANGQIISPTGTFPPPPGVPLFNLSTELGRTRYTLWKTKQYVQQELLPIYALHQGEPAWVEAWQFIQVRLKADFLLGPLQAENGDWLGKDNDGDGAPEPIYVEGHFREGAYIRAHYRATSEAY